MIGEIAVALLIAWISYSAVYLFINVQRARQMKVPIVIVPVSPMNVLWLAMEPLFFGMIDRLPFDLGTFKRYGRRGWHFRDKARSHVELGDVFALVTPRETFLHVAESGAIVDIFSRRMDFLRPVQLYSEWPSYLFSVFPDSLFSVINH